MIGIINSFRFSRPVEYGGLYNWYVGDDIRNITSSDDWIVPETTDMQTLITYVSGDQATTGGYLKEIGFTHWNSPNTGATDTFGFAGRGSGGRYTGAGFSNLKLYSPFWLKGINYGQGDEQYLMYHTAGLYYSYAPPATGYALRLTRLATVPESSLPDGLIDATYVGNDGKIYACTKIGTQIWIATNLSEIKYRNGDWIHGFDGGTYTPILAVDWDALTTGAMCYYNDDINNG